MLSTYTPDSLEINECLEPWSHVQWCYRNKKEIKSKDVLWININ